MAGGKRAVVLLSGGLDSATALALAIRDGFEAYALTVRYGQRHAAEIDRAARIARVSGVREHRVIDVDLGFPGGSALTDPAIDVPFGRTDEQIEVGIPATYVPARNTVLLSVALAWAETIGAFDLFLGINAVDYSGYPDCRPEFLDAFERLARLATKAGVEQSAFRIHAPLLSWSKARIVREAVALGVELGTTLSCYAPKGETGRPCGRCDACRLRAKGFDEAGISDPGLR